MAVSLPAPVVDVGGPSPGGSTYNSGFGFSPDPSSPSGGGTRKPVYGTPWLDDPVSNLPQGIVQAEFGRDEENLGLVIDWSLPLPVIAHVKPNSPAARFPELGPSLVLIRIGDLSLETGARRERVESMLRDRPVDRPLVLFFETPDLARFGFVPPNERRRPLGSRSTSAPALLPALGQTYFDMHPERVPISRYGNLATPIPPSTYLPLRESAAPLRPGTKFNDLQSRRAATPPGESSLPPVNSGPQWTIGHGDARGSRCGSRKGMSSPKPLGKVNTQSLSWLAAGVPRPDACYEHIVDAPRPFGPGPPARWPLHHTCQRPFAMFPAYGYICRIGDMVKAERIRDAYEVGFRAMKRDPPTAAHVQFARGAGPLEKRVPARIEDIICDVCGEELATTNKAGFFYYCRVCKKNGQRFELCASCHACEILQGEGKHVGSELHPHYLRCSHQEMVRRPNLDAAHPDKKHVRRAFCDHCGHLISCREDDTEIYICPRCPDAHGVRFELCPSCATDLLHRGFGVSRLRSR